MSTKSTPHGSVEAPVNPITSSIMNGATYVARGYSGDVRQLTELIKGAVNHKGVRPHRRVQPLRDLHSTTPTISSRTAW